MPGDNTNEIQTAQQVPLSEMQISKIQIPFKFPPSREIIPVYTPPGKLQVLY